MLYALHSSPIFILLIHNTSLKDVFTISVYNNAAPNQMASSEASCSGSTVFSKKDKLGYIAGQGLINDVK